MKIILYKTQLMKKTLIQDDDNFETYDKLLHWKNDSVQNMFDIY